MPQVRPDAQLGQFTHVGMVRTENQDALGYWEPEDDAEFERKGRLVVVCDGMGGVKGGRLAADLAIETILHFIRLDDGDELGRALWSSIRAANSAVYRRSIEKGADDLRGMGTTVTAIIHQGAQVYFGHVGDSRTYLIREGNLQQMTEDHSVVQQLVSEGKLDPAEAAAHEDRNELLRCLGPKPEVEVDVSYAECQPGDSYLLCSDGLTNYVSDEQILAIVQAGEHFGYDLDTVCKQLVDLANASGGHDNTTVQILRLVEPSEQAEDPAQDSPDS
jgi:protein phosphatase